MVLVCMDLFFSASSASFGDSAIRRFSCFCISAFQQSLNSGVFNRATVRLLNDLGHQVQAVLGGGRRLLVIVAAVWLIGNVVAQTQRKFLVIGGGGLGQRVHHDGVKRPHPVPPGGDAVELGQRRGSLFFAEVQLRQHR